MMTDKTISVVVACYRDEGSIHEMVRRLKNALGKISPSWEIVYVNDASPDRSEEVLAALTATEPRLTVVNHSRNFGAQAAFTSGMLQARGDCVVIMDGDLQDPPELIESFVAKWLEGWDVVYGIRAKRSEGMVRNVGYKVFYRLLRRMSYIDVPLDAGEFSLMDRRVTDVVLAMPERDRLIRGLRAFAGFRQTGIPFERPSRYAGESTHSLLGYMGWAMKSFTSFSFVPLQIISWLAIASGLIFLGLLAMNFIFYFLGFPAPKGFMTLIVVILAPTSVIMLSLGVISEYLRRMFEEVKARPQFIIKDILNDQRPTPRGRVGLPRF